MVTKTVTAIDFSHNFTVRTGSNQTFDELRTDDFEEACKQFSEWQAAGGFVFMRRSPDGLMIAEAQFGSIQGNDLRSDVATGNLPVPSEVVAISSKTLQAPRILRMVRNAVVQEVFDLI